MPTITITEKQQAITASRATDSAADRVRVVLDRPTAQHASTRCYVMT